MDKCKKIKIVKCKKIKIKILISSKLVTPDKRYHEPISVGDTSAGDACARAVKAVLNLNCIGCMIKYCNDGNNVYIKPLYQGLTSKQLIKWQQFNENWKYSYL